MSELSEMLRGMTVKEFHDFSEMNFRDVTCDPKKPDRILAHIEFLRTHAKKYPAADHGKLAALRADAWEHHVDTL